VTDNTPSPTTPTGHGHKHTSLLALLVVLVVVVIAGFYLGWKQLGQRDEQLAALRQQIARGEQTHDKLRHDLQSGSEQLARLETRLDSVAGYDRNNWRLAEAEVLLRLSNHYVLLTQDSKTADRLLMNADEVLQELESSAANRQLIADVRHKIADEHTALSIAANADHEGIYFRIEALVSLLDPLPVVDVRNLSKQNPEPAEITLPADAALGERLFASLQHALGKIGGYIRIQQHGYDKPPLLSPDAQQALKEAVRLRLETAQLALLQHRQLLYETSLKDAKTAIEQYYVLPPDTRKHLLDEIDACLASPVNISLPDIGDSLRALIDYQQTLHTRQEP
jgi:uroporphyrin-3 C-methyltransferase